MGWLSKLLKGSSSSSSSSSFSASSSSWSVAKAKYGCTDDSDNQSLSSRNSNKAEEETDCDDGSGSPDVVDEKDEYLNHHSYGQDHDEAGEDHELPTYNYNNYNLGTNVFQPYPFPSDHRCQGDGPYLSWTDAFWKTENSPRIQTYTGSELVYDNTPRKYFSYNNQHLICDVCKQQIPVDSSGRLQVKKDHIWKLKYCKKHYDDGTKRCHSCRRFEPMGTKYSSRGDGRNYCGDCNASAIMNIDECGPLIQQIYQFYQSLDMNIYQCDIQIKVIDRKEMIRRGHTAHTNGFTSTVEHSCLYTNIRTPSFGPDNSITGTKKQRFKLISYKEVRHIMLLYGCPRLYIGQTLAHEIMHAWLLLGGYVGPEKTEGFVGQVETKQIHEGLCQVMAHKWLESQLAALELDDFETKLGKHLMRDIEERRDYRYGGGFRLVNQSVVNYGLKGTLDYIRMAGKLPLYN